MSVSDDKLRIPIEIKTEDVKEIQQLIQDITEAESDLRQVLPKKGRGTSDVTSRSAFARAQPFDERGGIFGGLRREEATPEMMRDKTSSQPFQRQKSWDQLQDRIDTLEQSNNTTIGVVSQVANTIGLGSLVTPMLNIKKGEGMVNVASGLVAGKSAVSMAGGKVGKLGALGNLTGIIGKLGGVGFAVSIAIEVASMVVDFLQQPGGLLDVRFKRNINKELAQATDREEKAQIRQGIRLIHVSPYPTFRGQGTSVAGMAAKSGRLQFEDPALEMRVKGL